MYSHEYSSLIIWSFSAEQEEEKLKDNSIDTVMEVSDFDPLNCNTPGMVVTRGMTVFLGF